MKRRYKIKIIACIVFFFICLFFPPFPRIFPNQINGNADGYSELVNLYKRYFRLQEELFQRLNFKLSADQPVKSGVSFKLTLEDNLGRKWIFKEKGANVIIAQRLYALFGLDAPEIHKVKVLLNNKLSVGTLQKFIPAASTLYFYAPERISAPGLKYLMKAQAVDWLMRDHDPNCLNFLVLSLDKENRADGLIRIDQDACLNPEINDLDYERMVAIAKKHKDSVRANYYCLVEEAYRKKEIDLDLKRAYSFVRFIADFPQPLFEEVILDLKSLGANSFPENDPVALKKKYEFFGNSLALNKSKMAEGFRKLYSSLADLRGSGFDLSENLAGRNDLEEACESLRNKLNGLEKVNNRSDSNPVDRPVQISAIASLDGFRIMRRIYEVFWYKNGDLAKECGIALKNLARLRAGAQSNERKAISLYMQEIRKIQSGKGMTYPISQINKLVDPVLQKNKGEFD